MKNILLAVLMPLLLAGCLSFSSTSPPQTTVVVPPAGTTTIVCTTGLQPPC